MAKKPPKQTPKRPSLDALIEAAVLQGGTKELAEEMVRRELREAGARAPTRAQLDKAWAEVAGRWIEDAESDPNTIHAYHVRLRKHLYQKAYQLNDFKACLSIATDLAKIQQQYQRERQDAKRKAEREPRRRKTLQLIRDKNGGRGRTA